MGSGHYLRSSDTLSSLPALLHPLGAFIPQPRGAGLPQPPAHEGLFVWVFIQKLSGYGEKSVKSRCLTKPLELLLN